MASPERPQTGNRFSDSPETPPKRAWTSYQRSTSFKTGSANHPIASASTNHSHDVIRMTARYERSGRRDANHIDTMALETRQGRSYRPLCCLTLTTPRTTRHGELSSDPCSLGISVQGQPLHPCIDNLPQGLDNLGVHTCRPPTMARPRHFVRTTHYDRHVARQALRHAITSYMIGCDRRAAPALQRQNHSIDFSATATGYRARTGRLCSHDAT